jgi:hypothetical protein
MQNPDSRRNTSLNDSTPSVAKRAIVDVASNQQLSFHFVQSSLQCSSIVRINRVQLKIDMTATNARQLEDRIPACHCMRLPRVFQKCSVSTRSRRRYECNHFVASACPPRSLRYILWDVSRLAEAPVSAILRLTGPSSRPFVAVSLL